MLKEGKADVWQSEKIKSATPSFEYPGVPLLKPHTKYYWNVKAWNAQNETTVSKPDSFEIAKLSPNDWKANWITDSRDKEFEPAPLFRKDFFVQKGILSARLYVSAGGYV